jgi:hypothetical protein
MTSGVGTFGNSGACAQYATEGPMAPSRSQGEVDTVNESVARIEAIIGRKVKRDIGTKWIYARSIRH